MFCDPEQQNENCTFDRIAGATGLQPIVTIVFYVSMVDGIHFRYPVLDLQLATDKCDK